ncbi:hypothetical protein R1flu_000126 [Riccia fluitans]|uniref:Uncharacterized protein n=1 Tax=Riccia fluitans TaxID=41844 RepID=A0ABD1XZX5_9MARC
MTKLSTTLVVLCSLIALSLLAISAAEEIDGKTPKMRPHTVHFHHPKDQAHRKKFAGGYKLVSDPTLILDYHFGPVMTGQNDVIKLFVIYYGEFTKNQRTTLRSFFKSFWHPKAPVKTDRPTVEKWWQITRKYVDLYNTPVTSNIVAAGELFDNYSLGKDLNQSTIQQLVIDSFAKFGTDARAIYLVLTAKDVTVESFCMNVCGTHFYTFPSDATDSQMVPYGWVGNPATQCPELCAWPYAPGGSLAQPLIPPNGDVGIDGMTITIANILAGIGTDPYGNAYYQGDAGAPLEAAGACGGIYGAGGFPGYPGELLVDNATGASFNVFGARDHKFLVPWIWNPDTLQCAGQV